MRRAPSDPGPSPAPATGKSVVERRPRYQPPAEVAEDIRAYESDREAGRLVELTPEELEHWAKTGEWPESLD